MPVDHTLVSQASRRVIRGSVRANLQTAAGQVSRGGAAHQRHDRRRPRRSWLSLLLLLRLLLLLGRSRHCHIQAEQLELLRAQLLFPSAPL